MKRCSIARLALWGSVVVCFALTLALALAQSVDQIRTKTENSLVKVNVFRKGVMVSSGSGFIFSIDGLIGTNHHVIKEALAGGGAIEVEFEHSREKKNAKILNWDDYLDFAVLKVERIRGNNYKPL